VKNLVPGLPMHGKGYGYLSWQLSPYIVHGGVAELHSMLLIKSRTHLFRILAKGCSRDYNFGGETDDANAGIFPERLMS
jgi:hypothetical protein